MDGNGDDHLGTLMTGRRHPLNDSERILLSYLEITRDAFRPTVRDEWLFLGPADYVLKNGCFFNVQPHVPDCPIGMPGYCFANVYRLARRFPQQYRYTEGYAVPGSAVGHGLSHAWCSDAARTVVDPTWTAPGAPGIGSAYFGVVFTLEFLAKHRRTHKIALPVIDNWEAGFPILRKWPTTGKLGR